MKLKIGVVALKMASEQLQPVAVEKGCEEEGTGADRDQDGEDVREAGRGGDDVREKAQNKDQRWREVHLQHIIIPVHTTSTMLMLFVIVYNSGPLLQKGGQPLSTKDKMAHPNKEVYNNYWCIEKGPL